MTEEVNKLEDLLTHMTSVMEKFGHQQTQIVMELSDLKDRIEHLEGRVIGRTTR